MVARRVVAAVLIAALVVVAGGFDRGGYGGSQWSARQGGYWPRPKGAFEKWFPPAPAEEFAAVTAGSIYSAGAGKYSVVVAYAPACSAAATIRIRDTATQQTLGTNRITPNSNPAIAVGTWTLNAGWVVDVHYTADTSTAGYKDVTGWTELLAGWTVDTGGAGFVPVTPTE